MNVQKHFIRKEAASRWLDAQPLGNGFLGAMVYGQTTKDRIQLNEDSLWHGKFRDRINPQAKEYLPKVQQLILNRKFEEAEELMFSHMVSTPTNMRNFSTMGELDLALNCKLPFQMGWLPESDGEDYVSDLNLEEGILQSSYLRAVYGDFQTPRPEDARTEEAKYFWMGRLVGEITEFVYAGLRTQEDPMIRENLAKLGKILKDGG